MSASLRIWAPHAKQLSCTSGGKTVQGKPRADGHFELPAPVLGAAYTLSIDGGAALPDPRSEHQPQGPHGPSERVDHAAIAWHDEGFRAPQLASGIVYELHVGTFSAEGTFDGAIAHLDALVELGVTHVELMPVATFPGRHGWGYDGVALFAPHAAYGGPLGLSRLVDACHARGLAVILDVVYNHLGPDGNYLGAFGPYFTDAHRTPWGKAVNLDGAESHEVRRFFCDNALAWLERYHIDGLRLDAVHALWDSSAIHFLEQLGREVAQLAERTGRNLVLIAESDLNDPRLVRAVEAGGLGLDAQWSDDLHHALHAALTGERSGYYADFGALQDIATALTQGYVYAGRFSQHRRRVHGRVFAQAGTRLLGYLQTHDQVGNRARGERIGHLVGPELAKVGAALALIAPHVPMIFQGEEWGASAPFQYFTDHQSPELADAVRRGRREEFAAFGWKPDDVPDPQARETFERSKLDWSERTREPHAAWLRFYRELIALRRSTPDLMDGCFERVAVSIDEATRVLRVRRGAITLLANLGDAPFAAPAPQGELALSSEAPRSEGATVVLPARSVAIWSAAS